MRVAPLFIFSLFLVGSTFVFAEKNPLPRFVSLKSNEINQRVGPGPNYPVEWMYVKAGLPVEVTAEFDNWRKIRDKDGTEGWVHLGMLSSKRHGIIQDAEALIYAAEDIKSRPLVRLEPGVLVEILKCREDWCQIRVLGFKGWIQRSFLWGIYPREIIG